MDDRALDPLRMREQSREAFAGHLRVEREEFDRLLDTVRRSYMFGAGWKVQDPTTFLGGGLLP